MEEHPSPEKLRRFVAGELPQEEARKVMAHVLQGCQFCGEEASRYNLLRLRRFQPGIPRIEDEARVIMIGR